MSDETDPKTEIKDGDRITTDEPNDLGTKEVQAKEPKSVSFNRDVHVKRFGKPRESRSSSAEYKPPIRKEPFTHLSEKQLIEEANKVRAQAESVDCTTENTPEKFFSLPHRRKFKEHEKLGRRNSDESQENKKGLGRSVSDVSQKRRKERTSLSTLFRRAQRTKSPDTTVTVKDKPVVIVKRSKSDVSDLKSNTNLNIHPKPIRKRSGSESEEFLKSLRNKKAQLSPIIESSPREDYFKKTPPLDVFQKNKLALQEIKNTEQNSDKKVNPVEKPPRYKSPEKEPKPPIRAKRAKSSEKEQTPPVTETVKEKALKKSLVVDEVDCSVRRKDTSPLGVKDRIKESIKKIQENIYGSKDMIHSSQQPPDKPPLTRGHTVDHIVRILKEDQQYPSKSHIIGSQTNSNVNQPFSYTKPSVSPDPKMFLRTTSPDRVPTPVNTISDKGVVYAQVVRENEFNKNGKSTIHKTYSPSRDNYNNLSDEDEGLGYEERYKFSQKPRYEEYESKIRDEDKYYNLNGPKITDSPIKPRFREYKLKSFEDFEPTYANEYSAIDGNSKDFIDSAFRGQADGMDTKRKYESETNKLNLDFNELSHRRQLLESRINARKFERDRTVNTVQPITRYIVEPDPIYEAEKRMKATERYVNETAKYYTQTLERDGFKENSITEDTYKFDAETDGVKYRTDARKTTRGEVDRVEVIHKPGSRNKDKPKLFPPEPEYEPPSLEFTAEKPVLTPDEYTEKKYKVKSKNVSSHDVVEKGQKYKKDSWFGRRKGHYASNPEIAQGREDDYVNTRYDPKHKQTYHNSLKREKNRDKYHKEHKQILRHDSGTSQDYRNDESPRRYDFDSRLIDSGIENDFRKDSSGEIHRSRQRRHDGSDDDVRDTSMFLASERRHGEDNYPSEQIYANGEYITRFEPYKDEPPRKDFASRERSADDGTHFDPRNDRYERNPNRYENKISAKPPKATKKLSGLEKVKQLFSRDSSKKSKKEKEPVQPPSRTRVLQSPEHLPEDPDSRNFRDDPSDEERRRDYREMKSSKEDLDRHRSTSELRISPRDSDQERQRDVYDRYKEDRTRVKERHYRTERREERRRYGSSDRESDHRSPRPADFENNRREAYRKTRSKTADPMDSPALAERYRERRRLATPSPTPSPPRRAPPSPPPAATGSWFKSLDRLARRRGKTTKVEKESGATTEDESVTKKSWSKPTKPLNSPAKNLRFFGDTDQESDANSKHPTVTKSKSHPSGKSHAVLRKTTSNSSTNIDDVDNTLANKSYSMSSLHKVKDDSKYHRRDLHNISENHSQSENESNLGRRVNLKPPISPYDRSRSHSSSKTLKPSRADERRSGSRGDLRSDERGSSSELRSSKQDLNRDMKYRRKTPGNQSGESSTEGDSSHQSQRSVVYLHATTIGDIPDPGVLARNRSRDDVSSVNSSNLQVRTTQKSFSIFAPWTPKLYNEQHDVHYAQRPRKTKPKEGTLRKTKNTEDDRPATLQKKKSYSQTTLNKRPQNSRLTSSNSTLYRKPERRIDNSSVQSTTLSRNRNKKSQSSEVLNRDGDRERISRSISMPKDKNKKAGWFNLTNKKKQEINTRVR